MPIRTVPQRSDRRRFACTLAKRERGDSDGHPLARSTLASLYPSVGGQRCAGNVAGGRVATRGHDVHFISYSVRSDAGGCAAAARSSCESMTMIVPSTRTTR